jgi:hypothetical protein
MERRGNRIKCLFKNPKGRKKTFGGPRRRWENNTEINLREIKVGSSEFI